MANENEQFDAFREDYLSQPGAPRASSKREFLELPDNKKLKKDIRTSAIICYVGAGLSGLVGFLSSDIGAYILLDVAIMLDAGKNYQEITRETSVSTATISRVSRCLNYGSGGYRIALERLKKTADGK